MKAAITSFIDSHKEEIVAFLKSLLDEKAGSENAEAVSKVGQKFISAYSQLGFSCQRFSGSPFADHLLFQNHREDTSILLAGHMDTTFTSYDKLPEMHIDGNKCIGPGTGDMLGGLVVFLYAVKCLHYLGKLDSLPLTIFINSDEERGSPTSKPVFLDLINRSSHVLFAESGGENGEIVIGRRGKLSFDINIRGIEGHAGNAAQNKASAVEEVAHKILAIEKLNSKWPGTDANAGKVRGGIAGNTIAENALLSSDIRYTSAEHEAEIKAEVQSIGTKCRVKNCSSTYTVTSERPLWAQERNGKAQRDLVALLQRAAEKLGQNVATEVRKGTADANFFGSVGAAVIDGLGPIGFHDHSDKEYILLDSLFDRIALCTLALLEINNKQ